MEEDDPKEEILEPSSALSRFGGSGSNGPAKSGRLKKRWPRSTSYAKFATGIRWAA
jgi:hypothetical protein